MTSFEFKERTIVEGIYLFSRIVKRSLIITFVLFFFCRNWTEQKGERVDSVLLERIELFY